MLFFFAGRVASEKQHAQGFWQKQLTAKTELLTAKLATPATHAFLLTTEVR